MSPLTRRALIIAGVLACFFGVQQVMTTAAERAAESQKRETERQIQAGIEERRLAEETRRAALTPEQRATEDAATAKQEAERKVRLEKLNAELEAMKEIEAKKEANERARIIQAVAATRALKASLRDPDSVRWDSVLVNEDGTVACIEYRARNGFGGMNREFVVFTSNTATQSAAAWNKRCANKQMHDMRSAAP